MKKLLVIAASLAAFSSLKADTDLSMSAGYESKYYYRGVELADESMTFSIDASFNNAYLGMWTNQPIVGRFDNEFDFYGGLGFDLADGISLDVGGTLYYYPESGSGTQTFELYTGVAFESALNPAFYAYYDLDLEALTFEGSIGESFALDENSSLDVAGFFGWVDPDNGSNFTYVGVSADIVYNLSDRSAASVGVRFTDGSDGLDDDIYFGASISTGF